MNTIIKQFLLFLLIFQTAFSMEMGKPERDAGMPSASELVPITVLLPSMVNVLGLGNRVDFVVNRINLGLLLEEDIHYSAIYDRLKELSVDQSDTDSWWLGMENRRITSESFNYDSVQKFLVGLYLIDAIRALSDLTFKALGNVPKSNYLEALFIAQQFLEHEIDQSNFKLLRAQFGDHCAGSILDLILQTFVTENLQWYPDQDVFLVIQVPALVGQLIDKFKADDEQLRVTLAGFNPVVSTGQRIWSSASEKDNFMKSIMLQKYLMCAALSFTGSSDSNLEWEGPQVTHSPTLKDEQQVTEQRSAKSKSKQKPTKKGSKNAKKKAQRARAREAMRAVEKTDEKVPTGTHAASRNKTKRAARKAIAKAMPALDSSQPDDQEHDNTNVAVAPVMQMDNSARVVDSSIDDSKAPFTVVQRRRHSLKRAMSSTNVKEMYKAWSEEQAQKNSSPERRDNSQGRLTRQRSLLLQKQTSLLDLMRVSSPRDVEFVLRKFRMLRNHADFERIVQRCWTKKEGKHDIESKVRHEGTKFSFSVKKHNRLSELVRILLHANPERDSVVSLYWANDNKNLPMTTRVIINVDNLNELLNSLPPEVTISDKLRAKLEHMHWRTSKAVKFGSSKRYYLGLRLIVDWSVDGEPGIASLYPAGNRSSQTLP